MNLLNNIVGYLSDILTTTGDGVVEVLKKILLLG